MSKYLGLPISSSMRRRVNPLLNQQCLAKHHHRGDGGMPNAVASSPCA